MNPQNTDYAALRKTSARIKKISIALFCFLAFLTANLLRLQLFLSEDYRSQVYDQVTTTSALRAKRGAIYDANMKLLATDRSVWRIFVSPRVIRNRGKKDGVDYFAKIASLLSPILGKDEKKIYEAIFKPSVLDVTVEKATDEEIYRKVLSVIRENDLADMLFCEEQTTRYYPEGTLAAHLLGFVGSDAQGLYGLEYAYDKTLAGKNGSYLYAKDAAGNPLPSGYSAFIPAEDGASIVTTIDSYLQSTLEAVVEEARQNAGAQNRVTGVVMNVRTGAILAMATTAPFDPNSPYELSAFYREKLAAENLAEGSDEWKAKRKEMMEIMWSNKAVGEIYEPGSTFKIVTVSAALQSGAAKMTDRFSCPGYLMVGGWRIKCHKTTGHGSNFTLAYGLQMSCNPTMMTVAARIGSETFYDYVERFGYFEKSGIDLPSEGRSIFHQPEAFGTVELATASFGQRFKVSIISHLCAIAAVANGGTLVEPYVVEKVIDRSGNVISAHEVTEKRRVISPEVAAEVCRVLEEGVSGDGGAKNARVPGYKVAAKTGTSQKFDILDENGNSYLRIGSTVAFAPSDEAGIAMILIVDEPTSQIKYGSYVAAPYVSEYLSKALPYLGYEANGADDLCTLPDLVGMEIGAAKKLLAERKIACEIIGDGATVLFQTPGAEETLLAERAKVLLYTEEGAEQFCTVPDLVGKDALEANLAANAAGLNIAVIGVRENAGGAKVIAQSIPSGTVVARGSTLTLTVLYTDFED